MLYPELLNQKKNNIIIRSLLLASVVVSILLVLINFLTNKTLHWSILCIAGIIYGWVTTLYSMNHNVNIASHVMVQMICTSILVLIIDYIFRI